jgi:hypothetical protein
MTVIMMGVSVITAIAVTMPGRRVLLVVVCHVEVLRRGT